MKKLTIADMYGVGAAVALAIMVIVNNPAVMLGISAAGILVGFWVLSRGEVRRVAFVAFVAFVVAGAFAVFKLTG